MKVWRLWSLRFMGGLLLAIMYACARQPESQSVPETPTPIPPTIIFMDNFDKSVSQALPSTTSAPTYRSGYDNGEYFIQKLSAEQTQRAFVGLPDKSSQGLPTGSTDAMMAVDVRLLSEDANRYAAIVCRREESSTGYVLQVEFWHGQFRLSRGGGQTDVLLQTGTLPVARPATQYNRLELRCLGRTIEAWVNGAMVASVEDATYPLGKFWIGAGTTPSQLAVEARFDNLVISRP